MLDKETLQEATEIRGRVGVVLGLVGRNKEEFAKALDLEVRRMRDDMFVLYEQWLESVDA